jgi:hypothetical protein
MSFIMPRPYSKTCVRGGLDGGVLCHWRTPKGGGGLGSVVAYQQWEKGGQRGATDMRQQPSYMRCWKSPS